MSLIHWWPLNGDTKNYGTSGEQVTESSVTYTSGKIGQSMYKGKLNFTAEQWKNTIGNTISIAMWIYTREDGTYSAGTPFFGNGGMTKPNNRKFTMFHYPAKTTLHCSWQNDDLDSADKPNTYLSITYANFFEIGKWVHLCVVQDAATETVTIYRNGTQYSKTKVSGLATMNFKSAAAAPIRNNIDYQHINDIRIYDHALSQAEVKELSKALVMHYTFDDILAEPTTNESVLSNWSHYSTYWTSVETTATGWKLKKTSMSSSSTVAISNSVIYNKMAIGDIWTISCYLYKNDKPFKSNSSIFTNYLGTTPTLSYIARDDGYFSVTFRVDAKKNAYPIHAPIFGSDFTMDDIFEIRYLQVEKKELATPYTVGTRNSMIYNETGLVPTTNLSNVALSTNSATGNYSLKCNNSWIYNETSSNGQQFLTMAAWVNPTDYSGDGIIIGGAYLCINGSGKLYVYCYGRTPEQYFTGTTTIPTGQWTHIAVTWDDKDCTGYINGVQEFKKSHPGIPNSTHHNKKDIGSEHGTRRFFNGLIDDVRVYNTCLSGDDIADLCKTKAYISDQGDIMGGTFIEDKADIQVTSKKIVETFDMQELGNSEYTPIEYIASTGSQYIDTNYYWTNEKATIVADLEVTAWKASSTIFGSEERYSGSSRYFAHILHAGSANGNYANYIGQGSVATTTLSLNTRSKIEYIAHGNKTMTTRVTTSSGTTTSANKVSYAGTILTRQNSTQTAANRGHIYIFSNHNAYNGTDGIQKMAAMKLYRFTMYDNDICVRDFIPCKRNKDNAAGLFDNVTGEFYLSPNGVAFIAGPAVTLDTDAKFISGKTIQARNIIEL